MPGNQLYGVTESMHQLASQTGARADSMSSALQHLNSSLEGGLRSAWLGSGGNTFFTGHGVWNGSTTQQVVVYDYDTSDLQRNAANRYDTTDADAHSVMNGVPSFGAGGITGAINPSA